MDLVKINGQSFDVNVAIGDMERSFEVLDGDVAKRTLSGRMVRDIIGTFFGRKIRFFRKGDNYAAMDSLWNFLVACSIEDSVMLDVADGQETIKMEVYYTSAKQKLECVVAGKRYWGDIEVSFIPMEPQLTPKG